MSDLVRELQYQHSVLSIIRKKCIICLNNGLNSKFNSMFVAIFAFLFAAGVSEGKNKFKNS
jgi:hypothetical protein